MILSGKEVRKHYLNIYTKEISEKKIKVALFENIYDPASVSYAKQIKKMFKNAGIEFISIQIKLPEGSNQYLESKNSINNKNLINNKDLVNNKDLINNKKLTNTKNDKSANKNVISNLNENNKKTIEEEYLKLLDRYNNDKSVTGIFVQMPLVGNIDKNIIIENLFPFKDVEGITPYNLGKLFSGDETIVPPTAMSIIKVAEYYNIDFTGKLTAVVNRSLIVGKPLIPLLLNRNATVMVCHSKTKDLKNTLKKADIVITAAGKADLITEEHIKEGAVVLDAAINFKDGKMCGDATFETIEKFASITPVPGGIGPVTNTMILRNILNLYKLNNIT